MRHAAPADPLNAYSGCPACLETPVLDVLRLDTARHAIVTSQSSRTP
jgi:hypothetical protein